MLLATTPINRLAAAPAAAPATPIRPGDVLGTATVLVGTADDPTPRIPLLADVTAGAVLATGVRDIRATAQDLIGDHWGDGPRRTMGMVAFVRNGDAYDAVEMLAPTRPDGSAPRQVWSSWNLQGFSRQAGVDIAAAWQISGYGGEADLGMHRSTQGG